MSVCKHENAAACTWNEVKAWTRIVILDEPGIFIKLIWLKWIRQYLFYMYFHWPGQVFPWFIVSRINWNCLDLTYYPNELWYVAISYWQFFLALSWLSILLWSHKSTNLIEKQISFMQKSSRVCSALCFKRVHICSTYNHNTNMNYYGWLEGGNCSLLQLVSVLLYLM